LLRSIALAIAEADDAGVAAVALAEARAEFVEQFFLQTTEFRGTPRLDGGVYWCD
jgi:hypothetical protein